MTENEYQVIKALVGLQEREQCICVISFAGLF